MSVASKRSSTRSSITAWAGCVGLLVVTHYFIDFVGAGLEEDPRRTLFSWPAIVIIGAAGALGIFLAWRTGFPAAIDPELSAREWLLLPTLTGFALGAVAIGVEFATGGIDFFLDATGMVSFNVPLPGSPLFYAAGAVVVDVVYRLLPVPLLLWLISSLALRGRGQAPTFWGLAIVSSLAEPVSQSAFALGAGRFDVFAGQFLSGFAMNFAQAVWFRRAGFLAMIVVRWAMYLVWHILYGNVICNC